MSRRRSISSDISTDPKLAVLAEEHGPLPLLVYTWAIPHANDYGQIAADPTQFRLLVLPALPVKSSELAATLRQIEEAGLWSRRTDENGREYLQFPEEAWFKHQSYINATKRRKTAGDGEEQRASPQITANHRETAQKGVSPSPTPSPSPSLSSLTVPDTYPVPSREERARGKEAGMDPPERPAFASDTSRPVGQAGLGLIAGLRGCQKRPLNPAVAVSHAASSPDPPPLPVPPPLEVAAVEGVDVPAAGLSLSETGGRRRVRP